ncbi:MAG: efflux RND transporter periplasmic adaptor subunit [Rhodospirillales bacterium]|nr:efflux RND transporter periplasmic adaptor subunit [Rhodospirillales bacterium]
MRPRLTRAAFILALTLLATLPAAAQFGGGPPAVGTATARQQPVVETSSFVGRMQAIDKVDLVSRVTAFLDEIHFTEGAEVQKGDLLYVLERGPFEADVAARQATVAQNQALLRNANITLARAQALLSTPAGQRSAYDDAQAQVASLAAQVLSAQAQLRAAQINLAYTEIRAPVAGKITRTNVTVGNVVSPSSGPLATIYSQDPMYVLFPVSVRAALDLRNRYTATGGLGDAVVKLKLSDGRTYSQTGRLDYIEPTVAASTDTVTFRARMPNPLRAGTRAGDPGNRELIDGEFVTAVLESVEPVLALGIPRAAVLTDQQGNYVYVVGPGNHAEQRRIQLGQSTPGTAIVLSGLADGEAVIVDGLQRVRPGIPVNPAPAAPGPRGAPVGTAPPAAAPASTAAGKTAG